MLSPPPPPVSRPGMVPPSMESPSGPYPRTFGRYTLLRPLGAGGMAEVDLALMRSVAGFEKLVVIKRMLQSSRSDAPLVELFLHEARIAAALNHPNIVQVYDAGVHDGAPYIAMEYVPGIDVRALLHRLRVSGEGTLPLEVAVTLASGVLAGLSYAHERRALDGAPLRIVHRDISPPNVLVSYGGHVKVADFGIAQSGVPAPCAGHLRGKAPYMSPEQARGEAVDARSDLFSVGILLFELTTGRRLFRAATEWETMRLICRQPYPRPSDVTPGYPPALEAIVLRALARERGQRYGSARAMLAELESFAREHGLAASSLTLASYVRALFADEQRYEGHAVAEARGWAFALSEETSAPEGHDGGKVPAAWPSLAPMTYAPPETEARQAERRRRPVARMAVPLACLFVGAAGAGVGFALGGFPARAVPPQATLARAPGLCADGLTGADAGVKAAPTGGGGAEPAPPNR